jgi:hypothetical protein
MWRKLMSRLLRADIDPAVNWPDIASMRLEAQISVEFPRFWSRTETVEQALFTSSGQYFLLKRWLRSEVRSRVCFAQTLDAPAMRLTEWLTGPPPVHRLQLPPLEPATVTYTASRPTWFGMWRSQHEDNLGAAGCFIDGMDRQQLIDLRFKLLDGKIPESLRTEEEMWQRMHSMSELDRRAAYAALASRALSEVDRRFTEIHPDAGPVPEGLRPAYDMIQRRIQEVEQTAADRPVGTDVANLMDRFVAESMRKERSPRSGPEPDELDPNSTAER